MRIFSPMEQSMMSGTCRCDWAYCFQCDGEGLHVEDSDHEGTGPADHAGLVVCVEVLDAVGAGRPGQDRQAVDGDTLLDDLVARDGDQSAGVVGSVARDVDDAAQALIAAALEEQGGKGECRGDGGAGPGGKARPRQCLRHALRAFLRVDQPPGNDDALPSGPGPLHVGKGNSLQEPALNGGDHVGVADGLSVAVALQFLLAQVHGARDVHRQHQFQIDLQVLRFRPARTRRRQKSGEEKDQQQRCDENPALPFHRTMLLRRRAFA
jgi:hypothetical protein